MRLHEHAWGPEGAPEIVCLHGVNAHGRRFRRLAEERLAGRYRVRALDLRGHGRSAWDAPWTIDAHVEDVLDTVAETAVWIGHSFGGRVLLEVAAREPSLVKRAVLLDPALWVPEEIGLSIAERELQGPSFASAEEALEARIVSGGLAHTPRDFLEEEMREHLVESPDGRLRYRYSPEAVAAAYGEMARRPPPFESLRLPTLLVVAALAKLVSAGELELYRQALGDLLDVAVVPGGHIVLWDAYEETAAAIESFLARG
ncbi:MAG TPA: alpha/beta fold hydrolase [Gaiellaceae bacterium]|nr:alpha/beta fold hydrolase [Gaiellaceae bacterium]